MKRIALECEHCARAIDDGDEVRFEGYLVHTRCRTLHADELSARRVREDEASRAMLAEGVRL